MFVLKVTGLIPDLVQLDGSNLEPEDDDPQQTQDQSPVSIHHILWANQIHWNLEKHTLIGQFSLLTIRTKAPSFTFSGVV